MTLVGDNADRALPQQCQARYYAIRTAPPKRDSSDGGVGAPDSTHWGPFLFQLGHVG
jgi:hypothetical protein